MMTKRHQVTQAVLLIVLLVVAQYGTSVSAEPTAATGFDSNVAAGTADDKGHTLQRHLDDCGCGDCSAAVTAVQAAYIDIQFAQENFDDVNSNFAVYQSLKDIAIGFADLALDELNEANKNYNDAVSSEDKKLIKAARKDVTDAMKNHKYWLREIEINEGKIRKNYKKFKRAMKELTTANKQLFIMNKRLKGCNKKLGKCNRKCANGKI